MKIKFQLMFSAIFIAALMGSHASAQKIDYDFVPGTDFSKFKTYKWERAKKAIYPAKDLDDMFVRTIDAELAKKGLSRSDGSETDLVVTYQIAVLDDMEWSAGHSTIPWQGMVGVPGLQGGPVGGSNMIQKGSFILDLYDAKDRRQIWQAHATKTLADTTDLRKREKNTQKAMAKIMKNYPPQAK